ncbi:MAG: hypothetical protein ACI4LJ_00605 [Anaerovoracaceae bacterium]
METMAGFSIEFSPEKWYDLSNQPLEIVERWNGELYDGTMEIEKRRLYGRVL